MIYAKKPDGKEYVVEYIPFGLWWRSLAGPIINGVKVSDRKYVMNAGTLQKIWKAAIGNL